MVIQPPSTQFRRPFNATPPVFEKPPTGGRFIEGRDAHFECRIRGNPPPEVVWSKRGMPIRNDNRRQVSYNPETGICTFDIKSVTAEDDGDYTCTAVNCAGEAALTVSIHRETQAAQQTITRTEKVDIRTIRQPAVQQRYIHTERHIQDGVQFQRSVSSDYEGDPGSPLYYSGTEQGFRVDTFEYRLVREIEFRESLTRLYPGETVPEEVYDRTLPPSAPQVLQRPRNSKLLEGSDVTFQAKISGNPKPRIIWFKNGQRLFPSQRYKMSFADNVVTLHIHMALPEDAGYYTLMAQNSSGIITCSVHLVIEAVGVSSDTKYTSLQRLESPLPAQQVQQVQQVETTQTRYSRLEDEVESGQARTLKPNFVKVPTDKEVTEGKMVRFECRVSGRPFPEVLWYLNGVQIMDDSTHKLLVNEGGVHALMITVASRNDAGRYVCVAKNKSGEARFEVNLHVIEKEQVVSPKFVERFQSIHVRDGEPVTLHCRAVGTPIPRITWQKDGVQITSRPPDMIIETMDGGSTLYFNKVSYLDAGWYQCTAQNQAGSTATRARLYVEADQQPIPEPWRLNLPRPHKVIEPEGSPPRETIWLRPVERAAPYVPHEEERRPTQKPAFTTHLQDLNLQEGDRAQFDCRLIPIGDPTMIIEWFVNGRPIEASSRVMTIYRFGYVALTLLHVYAEDSGVYMCRATNEAGEATTTATLKCTARSAIYRETQHPESIEAIQHLEDWEHYKKEVVTEETVSTQKPVFIKPLRHLENLQEGGFAHFEAQITPVSDPTMKIEWFFNGQPLTAGSRISTIFSFGYVALNISYLRAEDSGMYMCKASNQKGEAMSTATLKVKVSGLVVSDLGIPEQEKYIEKIQELEHYQLMQRQAHEVVDVVPQQKPVFRSQLNDQKNIQESRTAHFEARLEPTGDSTMRVEWLKDGKALEASSRTTIFFNFGYVSLTIRGVDTRDAGTYTCVATNSMGSATSSAVLTCISKKSVVLETQYPEGLEKIQHLEDSSRYQRDIYEETTVTQRPTFTQSLYCQEHIVEGQSAHFETRLEPMGDPTMTVEWYFNGKPLTTGHRFKTYFDFGYVALDILYVFREDTGTFTVKAKNTLGEATLSKSITVQAKSDIDTSTIHDIGMEKIEYLERGQFQEPRYQVDEIVKSKPHFIIPMHDPKPVREGEKVHMECRLEPSTDPTMKVEWFFNGKPLMIGHRFQTYCDFGFVALDILTAYPEDTGEYTVRATNELGSAHTSACVRVQARSAIISETQHPEGLEKIQHLEDSSRYHRERYEETVITQMPTFTKALHNIETVEGSNIHLECRLAPVGDTTMKVEWFVNGIALKVGHRFRPAHEFDYVALDILSIYPEDSGVYTCKATSSLGQAVTSCSVKCTAKSELILETQHPEGLEKIQYLEDSTRYRKDTWMEETVKIRPKFISKLNNLSLREGQLAHFECRLEPISDDTLKIEWFHNGKPLPVGHRYRPFHDFGYAALNILSVVPEDSGTYTCRATNVVGTEEITATLTCQGKSSIILETQHPEGLQKIQQLEDYTRYTRTTEEEIVTQAPVFTSAPANVEIKEGQRTHFECRLIPVGDPNLKVEWFHNGIPIKSGTRFVETLNFGFVALDIMYTYPEDSGTYTCKATNVLGEAVISVTLKCYSKSGLILESQQPDSLEKIQALEMMSKYQRQEIEETTTQAPVFTHPMKNLQLVENQSAHFECRLIPVGDPKLKVEWFHNGVSIMKATRVTTTHDFGFVALDLSYVKTEDSGTYTCRATNELGQAACSATLTVKGTSSLLMETQHPEGLEKIQYLEDSSRYQRQVTEETVVTSKPVFITPLRGPEKLVEGQSSHLECRIEPYPDPTMKIEWFFNGKPLQTGHRFRTLYDFGFAALDILTVYAEDTGEYMIKATNKLGSATSVAKIHITAKKSLILESQQPESLEKIHYLEDASRYRTTTEQEILYNQKPAFGRTLYNLDNLIEGQSAHLEATLTPTNDPNLKVEWYFNGRPIQQGHRFKTTFDFGFVALDILYVSAEDSGTYMCKATNLVGEAVTTCSIEVKAKGTIYTDTLHEEGLEKIRLLEESYVQSVEEKPIVRERPVFITPLSSVDGIKEGQPAHLECRVTPITDPNLRIEWYVNGVEIKAGHRFRTTHDFGYVALDILYCYAEDSGTYMCKAVNELGEAVTTCTVKIQARRSIYYDTHHPEGLERIRELECQTRYETIEIEERPICRPYFTSELRGTTELTEGQSAHFECRVEPAHDAQLKVEFFHNGKPLDAGSRFHVTFDFGYVALDISHVFPQDEGTYTAKATNTLGEAVSSITIRIHSKSDIVLETQHPEGLAKIQALEDESRFRRETYIETRTFQRPVFTAPLQNLDGLVEGQSAHLECRLIPVGDPTLKVEWFFNDAPLQLGSRFQTMHDFGYVAMDIQYVRPDDTGVYMCRASNELGEAVTTASIKVKSKATIELQTQHPEGLEKIHELESAKEYRGPEAPEKIYERPIFTMPLTGPSELVEGQAAQFECRVIPVGDPNLRFEWFVNGIELQTGSRFRVSHDFGLVNLDIASTIPEDSGVYMCKAINKAGDAVTSASLKVRARHSVLSETQHPEALEETRKFEYDSSRISELWMDVAPARAPFFTQHLNNVDKVMEGHYIHLEARLEPANDEKLRVEWYKNGKQLVLGTRIRTTFDFGLVTLDVVSGRPDDSGIYTCRAVNEVGEAISTCTIKVEGRESILLGSQHPDSLPKIQQLETVDYSRPEFPEAVYDTPVFVTHLNNLELREGDSAHFHCQVEPAKDPTLTIEFLVNGKTLPAATRFTVKNDFGYVTLDISVVYPDDSGIYTCRATNSKGHAVTTGSLKVHGKDDIILTTQHPMGQEGLSKVRQVDEAYLLRQQGPFEEAEVQYPKPIFVVPLQANFTVNEGEGLRLQCRVEPAADPRLAIEWFFNGKTLSLGSRFMFTNDFGQVVMDISDLWPRDSGIYTCRAYNKQGEAFTSTTIGVISKSTIYEGTLHPEGEKGLESIQELEENLLRQVDYALADEGGHPPVFTSRFQNLTNLTEGDIAHFEATLTPAGDQTMVVEWFFKGQPLKAGHRIRTVHAFGMVVLEILGVYPYDTGEYTCRATNKWGFAEITVNLECVDISRGQKPHFTTQLQSLVGLKEGDSAHFECTLIPVGDPHMKVEWFHNGQPLRQSSRIKTLSDFGYVVMDISFVHVEDSGEYICVATNKFGSDTTRCRIECTGHGKIFRDTLQPQSLEKIAQLEGSYTQYRSQISIEGAISQAPRFETQIQPLPNLIEGQSAHFEAQLTPVNDPNMKVEWFFNGKPLSSGHRFRTFHDFGIVILDILYCYAEDSGEYTCKATNKFGTAVTKTTIYCKSKSSIILEPQLPPEMAGGNERIMQLEESLYRSRMVYTEDQKKEAPRFTVPLENLSNLREGENAHLEARLIPTDDPELRVEWYRDGKPLRAGTRIRPIHDFGFVVLEISPVYPEDTGLYSCRAINRVGEAVTTCTVKCEGKRSIILETQLPEGMETGIDKIAKLEQISDTRIAEQWMDVDVSQPPKFVTPLENLTLPENTLAHFECRLVPTNDSTMRVEWFHNGKPLITGSRVKTISDFGFVILEIAGVYTRDSGLYTCKAINRNGEATVSAQLTVKAKQSIVMEPQLPHEWRSGTESLQRLEESMYQTKEVIYEEDAKRPPHFITQIQDLVDKVEGDSARFECRLEPVGDPHMKVEWFLDGKPLTTGTRVHTIDDFGFVVLEIDWLFPRDSGEYLCRATNKYGSDTTKAILKIKSKRDIIMESQLPEGMSAEKLRDLEYPPSYEAPSDEAPLQPPHFITQIQPQENLHEGDSAHFECRLEPVNDPKLRVEWYYNGQPLPSGHRYKATHDFGFVALDVLYVYAEDSGEYTARAVNDLGEDITRTTLKCKGKPPLEYKTQLPKEMEGGVQKIAEMEASWQRVEMQEEVPQERSAPVFVMKPEPQVVVEGEWAKFCCRVSGYPKPRIMWVLNGNTVVTGSRYKLTYDGMYHFDVPKSRQYDQGKVEVYARNAVGEACCWTTLEVRPRHDDYRLVLKHSPRPWYDSEVRSYQRQRKECELEDVFEEKLTPGGTKIDVWQTEESVEGERMKSIKRLEEEDLKKLQPDVKRYKSEAIYYDPKTGEKRVEQQSQVGYMAKIYEAQIDSATVQLPQPPPTSPESSVYGKEIHVAKQKQTQKEVKGDLEITKHTTVTETMEQEHKAQTKERKVAGVVPETKPPVFIKKIQPCRSFEGESAKFECVFTGQPAPTITWFRENFPITSSQDFKITTTDKKSTLVIREVYLEDSGVFSVKAENRGGSAKSSANLVVEERREQKRGGVVPPSFSRTIQDCSVKINQLVRLDAKVTGSKPLDVYWLKNGKKMLPDITHKLLEEDDLYTLLILEAVPEDAGSYECVAINKAGEARCQANVHIESPAKAKQTLPKEQGKESKIPEVIEPLKDITVKEGQSAVFSCKISAMPAAQVKWYRGDSLVKQSRYFRMSVEKDVYTLRVSEAFPEDEGIYKCVASNPAGMVTTSANLKVLVPEVTEVSPSLSPLADLTVPEGTPARFVTSVTGTPTPKITWYREGAIIKPTRDFQMFQDGGSCSLVIRQTFPEDEGMYSCRATNASGQAETSARLTVESKH